MTEQILQNYEIPTQCRLRISNLIKIQWKRKYTTTTNTRANTFWTAALRQEVKSKKTLVFLKICTLKVRTTHQVWRNFDTSNQVKRSIVRARILTGTYTIQSSKHTYSKKVSDARCLLEDIRLHRVCRCPAFYKYRHTAVRQQ